MNKNLRAAIMVPIIMLFVNGVLKAQDNTYLQDSTRTEPQIQKTSPNTIKSEDFNKGFIISPYELIQGRIPGLSISSNNGSPNGYYIIKKAGNYKADGDMSPIIIIDNVQQFSNSIEINPKDIESISYQAYPTLDKHFFGPFDNGALIIKTKKGTEKLNIEFSGSYAMSELVNKIDVFNTKELAVIRDNKFPSISSFNSRSSDINTDWQDQVYRSAVGTNYHIGASGTIGKWLPFRASIGNSSQEGIVMTSKYETTNYNIRFNPTFLDNHLNFDLSMRINNTDSRHIANNSLTQAIYADPGFKKSETKYGFYNPYLFLRNSINKSSKESQSINANVNYKLQFLPHVDINLGYSNNNTDHRNDQKYNKEAYWFNDVSDMREIAKDKDYDESLLKASINYSKLSNNGNSTTKLSLSYQKYDFENSIQYKETGAFKYKDYIIAHSKRKEEYDATYKAAAFSYSYLDKYTTDINYSIMSNSYNDKESYSTTTLSFLWNIKKEALLLEVKNISSLYMKSNYQNTETPNFINNSNHDKSQSYKIGLFFGFFNERISGSISYRKNNSEYSTQIAALTNYTEGEPIESKSNTFIYTINSRIINTNIIRWDLSANITYSTNKVNNLKQPIITGNMITKNGEAINTFYLDQQEYDIYGDPVEGRYKNQEYYYSNEKRIARETFNPKYIIGLQSNLKISNWSLSCSGRAHTGNYIYNAVAARSFYRQMIYGNTSKYVLDSNFSESHPSSDIYLSNGAFFRMDYISLAYNFNKLFKKRVNINLSATVQNAFVITSYDGEDPERSNGIDEISFPRPRIYSLSLKLTFK